MCSSKNKQKKYKNHANMKFNMHKKVENPSLAQNVKKLSDSINVKIVKND